MTYNAKRFPQKYNYLLLIKRRVNLLKYTTKRLEVLYDLAAQSLIPRLAYQKVVTPLRQV